MLIKIMPRNLLNSRVYIKATTAGRDGDPSHAAAALTETEIERLLKQHVTLP